MIELKQKGLSYHAIANIFGISRQRVHQIISGYYILNHSLNAQEGWYAKIVAVVLERDNYQCQRCNSKDTLLIHHQDENDNHNELGNLITLCSRCHLELHRPKKWHTNVQRTLMLKESEPLNPHRFKGLTWKIINGKRVWVTPED